MRHFRTAAALALTVATALPAADVLTAQYDNARTSANLAETILNTGNVQDSTFGRLFVQEVEGEIYAQPLYVHGLAIPNRGAHNVVYLATMHNTVYAFDADDGQAPPLWSVNLGPSHIGSTFGGELGILPTPVISRSTGCIYVVAAIVKEGKRVYELHAMDLGTGREQFNGPVRVEGKVSGSAPDAVKRVLTFDPGKHLVRAGLALVNGNIYLATAPSHDETPSHGWVFGYDSRTLVQTGIFNATADGILAGIWQSGRAMAADENGFLYFETGNGDWDGRTNFGQSFVKLSTDGSLKVADWFTPEYWEALNGRDWDIGSSGPLLIPNTNLVAGGSKIGVLFVMDRKNMGRLQRKGRPVAQSFLATKECTAEDCFFITGQAYWNNAETPTMFVWGVDDRLKAFRLAKGKTKLETEPAFAGEDSADYPGGELAVSADGSRPGTAILWAITQDHASLATLRAFDAADPRHELWNSSSEPPWKASRFVAPVVADGKVFVTSESGKLFVYGLRGRKS